LAQGELAQRQRGPLALLIGLYCRYISTSSFLFRIAKRPLAVLGMVVLVELVDQAYRAASFKRRARAWACCDL